MRHHGCGDPDPGGLTLIIWLNGAFGSGKTTLTRELHRRLPDAVIFDPEYVGYGLTHGLNSCSSRRLTRGHTGLVNQTTHGSLADHYLCLAPSQADSVKMP
jgi:hypothetical protein